MAAKLSAKDKELIEQTKQQEEFEEIQFSYRVEDRERFKLYQPIVYQMLNQSLKQGQLAHAYLFSGTQGCFKKEAAILFAQSLFLQSKGIVKEEELDEKGKELCRRVAEASYGNLLFFDGYQKEAIGREDILGIQTFFSKTSLEESNQKVYIIDHAENMSIAAMNGLLKFLEEPSENVVAILTTDNIERLLPTVISRCVVVPFRELHEDVYYQLIKDEEVDEEDAFLLSRLVTNTRGYEELVASKPYMNAKAMLKQFVGMEGERDLFLVDYEVRYRLKQKDLLAEQNVKDANLDQLLMFFGMLIGFYKDVIHQKSIGPSWYSSAIEKARQENHDYAKRLEIAVSKRDACNRMNDLNLLLDQAVYEMEAV